VLVGPWRSFISFIGPLDWRWVVVPSILLDHWLCPMRHQRRVLCRLPVVASTDGEAGHVDVSIAACCRGGDHCLDSHMQCHVGRSDFWKSSYLTKHRTTLSRDLVTNTFLASPVYDGGIVAKSYQRIPSIRRWHDMLNASSFCSSDFSSVQVSAPCRRTETTKALYSRSFVDRINFLSPDIRKLAHYA